MFIFNKREILKKIVLLLTGLLISQWAFAIKDLSLVSNLVISLVTIVSLSLGFSIE